MEEPTATYTTEDLAAVTRYLAALVASNSDEHRDALLTVLDGNPYARLVALAHLAAGVMVESPTPTEEALATVFALSGRVADAMEEGQ